MTRIPTTYTVYYADGTPPDKCSIDWPSEPSYKQIRDLVEPLVEGPIEHVTILDPNKVGAKEVDPLLDRRDMFVDEMGHMRTDRRVRNEEATKIYRANTLRVQPERDPDSLHYIVGTAVVFDRIVWY